MHRWSGGAILAGGWVAGASFGRAVPLLAATQAEQPLREIAGARGIRYGGTAMASQLLAGDSFTNLLIREVAALVPENEMKWLHMSTAPFQSDYRMADCLVDFPVTRPACPSRAAGLSSLITQWRFRCC